MLRNYFLSKNKSQSNRISTKSSVKKDFAFGEYPIDRLIEYLLITLVVSFMLIKKIDDTNENDDRNRKPENQG